MNISMAAMSLNLYQSEKDRPEDSWERRKYACVDMILKYAPTVLCTQHGLEDQLNFLKSCLPGYDYCGVSTKGPLDSSDEFTAIFYDSTKIERTEGGTFWLSETPSIPYSVSWSSSIPSIATWATFQIKRAYPPGFSFQVLNAQLNCVNEKSKMKSTVLLWKHIGSLPPTFPVLLMGDFGIVKNSNPGLFLLGRSRYNGFCGDMRDAWASARRRRNYHIKHSFHHFRGERRNIMDSFSSSAIWNLPCFVHGNSKPDAHTDWMFCRGRSFNSAFCEIVTDNENGNYPTSHYPLYAEFTLPRTLRLMD